jgi:TPR repeat protein
VAAGVRIAKAFFNGGVRAERSYSEAFKWFEVAANGGSPEAKAWLGASYLFGLGVAPDLLRGKDLIEAAANEGSPVATRFLGLMYLKGVAVHRDSAKAISLLRKAGDQGDGYSFNELGLAYRLGDGVEQNVETAKSMFEKGAALNDGWALLHLGELYAIGDLKTGKNKDLKKALQLYSAAQRAGNPIASFKLAKMHETGFFGKPQLDKIFACYQEAAIRGFGVAQVEVGKAYQYGIGTEANPLEAFVWYSLGSERGNREAARLLEPLIDKLSYEQMTEARALLVKRRKTTGRILGR